MNPDPCGKPILLPCNPGPDGERHWRGELEAGLHQVSVIADASAFPMEELYYEMHEFGNGGARTGPWDYKPMVGSPLIPAFWVHHNGEKLGLWVFARISVEDLKAKRFRGRFAFRVHAGGMQHLRLVPYREAVNRAFWQMALLEPDPVDHLDSGELAGAGCVSKCQWASETFWEERRRRLTPAWQAILERALGWALDPGRAPGRDEAGRHLNVDQPGPRDMTAYVAGWRLFGNDTAREKGVALLEELIALPGWGRANEEIYGWDGDLVAIEPFRAVIEAYYGLDLPRELKARTLSKLRYQGNRFIVMALLTRDYWGGSVLQDHGWQAILGFAECAVALAAELEEARHWLQWVVPRFRQTLAAMPRDGHLPASSYGTPALYVSPLARLRQAWLEASGEDLYAGLPVRPLLERLGATLEGEERLLVGSALFLSQMNAVFPASAAAAWLGRAVLLSDAVLEKAYFSFRWQAQGLFEGFLAFPLPLPEGQPGVEIPPFVHFEDQGAVRLSDRRSGLRLRFQCGPWLGFHAYSRSDNPCDRMCTEVGPGSFTLDLDGENLLAHPDSNYALRSGVRNTLLIGGVGQFGDIGYPMSLPAWVWRGERITMLRYDEGTGAFRARLDLAPLYPDEAGVIAFTRDFVLEPGGPLICRDRIQLRRPKSLEWRFHTTDAQGIASEGPLACRIGKRLLISATPVDAALALNLATHPTQVVYSYTGSGRRFLHAAFASREAVSVAEVDFSLKTNASSKGNK